MELRNVEPVCVAHAIDRRRTRALLLLIVIATALRFAAGAILPLSADEAYYWLWSKHLALGYYDHPPMIAAIIRAGTMVFGDTAFGVRLFCLLLSLAASWAVWRSAMVLFANTYSAVWSCLAFNLTLMVAIETMAATPDAPVVAGAAFFVLCLAEVEKTEKPYWWLAAGVAAGFSLLSKYTAFFLGAGALLWLVFDPRVRHWLLSPWPYFGGLVAAALFLPNLWWNATHDWMTFAFQLGRVDAGHFTLRFLAEFLAAQLGLITPFILVLAILGMFPRPGESKLPAAMIWPSIAYFLIHALHDRVQGNWPSFLVPALSLSAMQAQHRALAGAPVAKWSRRLAIPVAAVILGLVYGQALLGIVSIGRKDPLQRLLAFGVPAMTEQIAALTHGRHAAGILTTDYETTAWLRFYLPPESPAVIPVNEPQRWRFAPAAPLSLLSQPLFYVSTARRDDASSLASEFSRIRSCGTVLRSREGQAIGSYRVYCVAGPRKGIQGRLP